jgi:hypothetical protein
LQVPLDFANFIIILKPSKDLDLRFKVISGYINYYINYILHFYNLGLTPRDYTPQDTFGIEIEIFDPSIGFNSTESVE